MRSDNKTRAIVVGIFITLALAIFILGTLTLKGRRSFGDTVAVKAVFDNTSGLLKGGNVMYSGVKVGVVKKISLMPDSKVQVDFEIDADKKQFIPKDVKAKIGSDGFIGNKILTLTDGNSKSGAIADGMQIGTAADLSTDDIMNTLQTNNKNLVAITTNLKEVMQHISEGKGSIGRLIQDDALANDLQYVLNSLKTTSVNAQQFTADLKSYTNRLQSPGSLTNNLVTDTVIFARLRAAATQADQITAEARTMVNKLNAATDKLNDNSTPAGLLLNDEKTAANIKEVVKNLQSGTKKLDENLEALKHNFLLRGYFRKQEKNNSQKSIQDTLQ